MTRKIGVAVVGDVLDINTWSNIPYFFYSAGADLGVFSQPWRVDVSRFKFPRMLWNSKQLLFGNGVGGFQYSDSFLDACEKQIPAEYFGSTIISFNQLFPRAASVKKANGKIYYYIDSTLHDLFNQEVYNIRIPGKMKQLAMDKEADNYKLADGVVTMGQWAQQALVDHYRVDRSKLFQILPGANIDMPQGFVPRPYSPGAGITRELTLGFVGKDWKRKGLSLLVDVRDKLVSAGIKTKVVVIGNAPDELKSREGVIDSGFIDKRTRSGEFIDVVSQCDFGCLFSSSEALGISTLEFIRLGVPVTGFYHQGLKDTLIDGASVRFNLSDDATTIADTIASIVRDDDKMRSLRQQAAALGNSVTWHACVDKWMKIIQ